jgi:hypothetical protein
MAELKVPGIVVVLVLVLAVDNKRSGEAMGDG